MIQLRTQIDMPEACIDCPFDYDSLGCMAIEGDDGSFSNYKNGLAEDTERLPNCPLEEIIE